MLGRYALDQLLGQPHCRILQVGIGVGRPRQRILHFREEKCRVPNGKHGVRRCILRKESRRQGEGLGIGRQQFP